MEAMSVGGLGRIGQIALMVKDLGRAVAFYRDKLGIPFLFQTPNLAFFDCGGVRLMLSPPEGQDEPRPGSILYFVAQDIHEHTRSLKERGVEVFSEPHMIARMPDHELWMSFFHDGEGNTLALMAEVR